MEKRTVLDFFDNEYLDYAKYIVEQRAIPSCIDGFKPTQRKVIFVANNIWKNGNEKPMKLFQLGGRVAADSYYHHGDAGLLSSIVNMVQVFKNSLPLLDGIGQFGSLRNPYAGAPRYISTKLNQNFKLVYKDFELLENKVEEGIKIEPHYFLPIIPMVILNGTSGIAIGFSTSILNRYPIDVVDACISTLNNKPINILYPWINGFNGKIERDVDNLKTWKLFGSFEVLNTTTVKITEIPPNYTYEKYEAVLNNLIEKKIIVDYEDNSSDNIEYVVKFQRSILKKYIEQDKLSTVLKLNTQETENLTTLDENNKLKIFDNVEDIIKYFVEFRLKWYQKRKDYLISNLNKDIKILLNKAKFIKDIIDKKLKINNIPKKEIELYLKNNDFDLVDNSYNYLLYMPIYSLTKEKYEELLKMIDKKQLELDIINKKNIKEMYLDDLKNLKIELNKQIKK